MKTLIRFLTGILSAWLVMFLTAWLRQRVLRWTA